MAELCSSRLIPIADLKPHKRNYRKHPADQLEHLAQSIKEHGFYRNVVVAKDLTILAGHGIVQAATLVGLTEVPTVVLDLKPNDPRALKLLAGDNEIAHLVESDDRALTELLKEVNDLDMTGLLGTGYDAAMLAALVMTTRPASEIADMDEAAEWAGMPEYENTEPKYKLVVSFVTEDDREAFVKESAIRIDQRGTVTWSTRWPWSDREALSSLRFVG